LGPFTIVARKNILKKLLAAQKLSGFKLIGEKEILEIKKMWKLDANKKNS
jgi:hypothetical protein